MAILLIWLVLPVGGVALGRVCACRLVSALSTNQLGDLLNSEIYIVVFGYDNEYYSRSGNNTVVFGAKTVVFWKN